MTAPSGTMRAAVATAPGIIHLEHRPTPSCGPGELLVRVRSCGLCGSDLARLRSAARLPAVLGHEVVGDVVRAGDGVRAVHLFVGDGEGMLPIGEIYHRELTYSSSPADLAEAFELVTTGAVRVAERCSHRLPLERLDEAARLMERREALKVYVEVGAG